MALLTVVQVRETEAQTFEITQLCFHKPALLPTVRSRVLVLKTMGDASNSFVKRKRRLDG